MNRKTVGILAAVLCSSLLGLVAATHLTTDKTQAMAVPTTTPAATFSLPGADRPHDMAVDKSEHSIWVASVQPLPGNRLFRIDTQSAAIESCSLPGDGTLAGAPLCATPDAVWIAVGHELVRFDKASKKLQSFPIPDATRIVGTDHLPHDPLTGAVPTWFGVVHLAADSAGSIWMSRVDVNSLLEFEQSTGKFVDHPLPTSFGSAEEVAPTEDGAVWLTEGVSGDSLGSLGVPVWHSKTAIYSIADGTTRVFAVPSRAINPTKGGAFLIGKGAVPMYLDGAAGSSRPVQFTGKLAGSEMHLSSTGHLFVTSQPGQIDQIGQDGSMIQRVSLPTKETSASANHLMFPAGGTSAAAPAGQSVTIMPTVAALDEDGDGVTWALVENFSLVEKVSP